MELISWYVLGAVSVRAFFYQYLYQDEEALKNVPVKNNWPYMRMIWLIGSFGAVLPIMFHSS